MNSAPELYACLYVREFPAQAMLRLRSALSGRPCVVMQGDPPLQQVCALSAPARALGIVHGMTQVEIEAFTGVAVLRRSLSEESSAQNILLECASAFSPRIEVRAGANSFCCVLDIAGTERLFGAPVQLLQSLLHRVRALHICSSAVVSQNLHAAITLAKAAAPDTSQVIATGYEAQALAPLPLSLLDLDQDRAALFDLWGIRSLGMLAQLPDVELVARIGQQGRVLQQMARGQRPHLFRPTDQPFSLQERMELDAPLELLDGLLFVLNLMLDQLIQRASARALALASVTVTLHLERNASHVRMVRPALPTNDRRIWLKLLQLDLEAHPPQAAILCVALHAEPGQTTQVQLGLFSPQLPEPTRLDVTLARIRAIVGEHNVGRAVLEDSHRADAFRMEPFRLRDRKSSDPPPTAVHPAIRQLRPPERVTVDLQNGKPQSFFFRDRRYIVQSAYGPWLTSGAWWSTMLWASEQWDLIARADDGPALSCCMVFDSIDAEWRMAALYD